MLSCKMCSLNFESNRALNAHNMTTHMRGFMINTDAGLNIMFSRVGRGMFSCPTCYKICHDFEEISSHLFCEAKNEYEEEFKFTDECNFQKTRKSKTELSKSNGNMAVIGINSESGDNEEKYGFIFTSPTNCKNLSDALNEDSQEYIFSSLNSEYEIFKTKNLPDINAQQSEYHGDVKNIALLHANTLSTIPRSSNPVDSGPVSPYSIVSSKSKITRPRKNRRQLLIEEHLDSPNRRAMMDIVSKYFVGPSTINFVRVRVRETNCKP